MKSAILIVVFALLGSTSFANETSETIEQRVSSLEEKVNLLEKLSTCLSQKDGVVLKGAYMYERYDGKWRRSDSYLVANFAIELIKKVKIENGIELAVVNTYAPGYENPCSIKIVSVDDLILK